MTDLFPGYLTVAQTARKLGVHHETIKRLLQTGELPGRKVHRIWLVSEDAVNQSKLGHGLGTAARQLDWQP